MTRLYDGRTNQRTRNFAANSYESEFDLQATKKFQQQNKVPESQNSFKWTKFTRLQFFASRAKLTMVRAQMFSHKGHKFKTVWDIEIKPANEDFVDKKKATVE